MGLPFDDAVTKPCYGTTEPFSGVVEVPRSTTEDEFSIAPRRTKLAVVGIVALCFVMSLGGAPRTRSSAPGQGPTQLAQEESLGEWCLKKNIAMGFEGLGTGEKISLLAPNDHTPAGQWSGRYRWYYDDVRALFEMDVTAEEVTYGHWEAGGKDDQGMAVVDVIDYIAGGDCQAEAVKALPVEYSDFLCSTHVAAGNLAFQESRPSVDGRVTERWGATVESEFVAGLWGVPVGTQAELNISRNIDFPMYVVVLHHWVAFPEDIPAEFNLTFFDSRTMDDQEVEAAFQKPQECSGMSPEGRKLVSSSREDTKTQAKASCPFLKRK